MTLLDHYKDPALAHSVFGRVPMRPAHWVRSAPEPEHVLLTHRGPSSGTRRRCDSVKPGVGT